MGIYRSLPRIGISAIGIYEPPWVLGNDWFGDTLPPKFLKHTGIESRRVLTEDEVAMAVGAVENLQRDSGLRLADCVGAVFCRLLADAGFDCQAIWCKRWNAGRTAGRRGTAIPAPRRTDFDLHSSD